ncbi:Lymphocyte expansion molecule isoform 1 [Schistosoma japonicum]|nr:Lymphocyte expansion molecule [Schistosoma japonicum]TNN19369.1 Lymphocyte expansion molecule isoform 1 [Schistosoma japonicum]
MQSTLHHHSSKHCTSKKDANDKGLKVTEKPPFGSNTDRQRINVHPRWRKEILSADLGLGCYDHNSSFEGKGNVLSSTHYKSVLDWKRQYESQRNASIPTLFSRSVKHSREIQLKNLGPGRYNISREIQVKGTSESIGPINTRAVRFVESKMNNTPGVGTYGMKGDPYLYKEIMDAKHKSSSIKGFLECGGDTNRSLPPTGCHIAPGTYEIIGSVQRLLEKKTGNRGPYDLMTGPRNYDYTSENPEPGAYTLKCFTSDLLRPEKRYAGKFSKLADEQKKMDRSCSSRMQNNLIASRIGPGYYEPKYPDDKNKSFNKHAPSFLSSSSRDSDSIFAVRQSPVGPGRYNSENYDQSRCIWGAMCSFDSTSSARLSLKEASKLR